MSKEHIIQTLWESSAHGTQREDVEAAYDAGASSERAWVLKYMQHHGISCDQLEKAILAKDQS